MTVDYHGAGGQEGPGFAHAPARLSRAAGKMSPRLCRPLGLGRTGSASALPEPLAGYIPSRLYGPAPCWLLAGGHPASQRSPAFLDGAAVSFVRPARGWWTVCLRGVIAGVTAHHFCCFVPVRGKWPFCPRPGTAVCKGGSSPVRRNPAPSPLSALRAPGSLAVMRPTGRCPRPKGVAMVPAPSARPSEAHPLGTLSMHF